MTVFLFVEGGGDSETLRKECRAAFGALLERAGFAGRMPRIVACGGRGRAFDHFKTKARELRDGEAAILLVDSEDPVKDPSRPWAHVAARIGDEWERPDGATDDSIHFMATCMETWIVADRKALQERYGKDLRERHLPEANAALERRRRQEVLKALFDATGGAERERAYAKGKKSFELLAQVDPAALRILPHYRRFETALGTLLQAR